MVNIKYFGQRQVEVAALKASFEPIRRKLDGESSPLAHQKPSLRLHLPESWLPQNRRIDVCGQAKVLSSCIHKIASKAVAQPEDVKQQTASVTLNQTELEMLQALRRTVIVEIERTLRRDSGKLETATPSGARSDFLDEATRHAKPVTQQFASGHRSSQSQQDQHPARIRTSPELGRLEQALFHPAQSKTCSVLPDQQLARFAELELPDLLARFSEQALSQNARSEHPDSLSRFAEKAQALARHPDTQAQQSNSRPQARHSSANLEAFRAAWGAASPHQILTCPELPEVFQEQPIQRDISTPNLPRGRHAVWGRDPGQVLSCPELPQVPEARPVGLEVRGPREMPEVLKEKQQIRRELPVPPHVPHGRHPAWGRHPGQVLTCPELPQVPEASPVSLEAPRAAWSTQPGPVASLAELQQVPEAGPVPAQRHPRVEAWRSHHPGQVLTCPELPEAADWSPTFQRGSQTAPAKRSKVRGQEPPAPSQQRHGCGGYPGKVATCPELLPYEEVAPPTSPQQLARQQLPQALAQHVEAALTRCINRAAQQHPGQVATCPELQPMSNQSQAPPRRDHPGHMATWPHLDGFDAAALHASMGLDFGMPLGQEAFRDALGRAALGREALAFSQTASLACAAVKGLGLHQGVLQRPPATASPGKVATCPDLMEAATPLWMQGWAGRVMTCPDLDYFEQAQVPPAHAPVTNSRMSELHQALALLSMRQQRQQQEQQEQPQQQMGGGIPSRGRPSYHHGHLAAAGRAGRADAADHLGRFRMPPGLAPPPAPPGLGPREAPQVTQHPAGLGERETRTLHISL